MRIARTWIRGRAHELANFCAVCPHRSAVRPAGNFGPKIRPEMLAAHELAGGKVGRRIERELLRGLLLPFLVGLCVAEEVFRGPIVVPVLLRGPLVA